MLRTIAAAALLAAVPFTVAESQTCEGRPGRTVGKFAVDAGFSSGNDATQFAVGVTGLSTTTYGGVTVGSIDYDGFGGSTTTLGGNLGYQLPMGTTGRAQLCPFLEGAFGFGPNNIGGLGIDISTRDAAAGLVWGYRAKESDDFTLIPTIGAGFAYAAVTFSDGTDDLTESETFGMLRVGLGMVLAKRLSISPTVMIPVGLEDADPMVGVTLSLMLGGKP